MTFRQNGQYTGFSGQIVPFLALWDDVIEGRRAPNSTAINVPSQGVLVVLKV